MILFIFKNLQNILDTQSKSELTESINESQPNKIKLNFDDDFDSDDEVIYYITFLIGVLSMSNCMLFIFNLFMLQSFFNPSNIIQCPNSSLEENSCLSKFDINDDHKEVLLHKNIISIHKPLINLSIHKLLLI